VATGQTWLPGGGILRDIRCCSAAKSDYAACASRLPDGWPPYAWYLRVPDLPGFVRPLAPALEGAAGGVHRRGHTGELKLSFYRTGCAGFGCWRLRWWKLGSHRPATAETRPSPADLLQLLFAITRSRNSHTPSRIAAVTAMNS